MTPRLASVCICIATFRRCAGLERLLRSLSELRFSSNHGVSVRVAIADNDPAGSAFPTVQEACRYLEFPLIYEIEPVTGISFVRNRAVRMAGDCDYVAFLDDDEFVDKDWLDELLSALTLYGAEVAIGPVVPSFDYPPPGWLLKGRFLERARHPTGTLVDYGRTGNALVAGSLLNRINGPFNTEFALTGAEDTLLFQQMLQLGARIVWCDEALVTELNPASRDLWWLLRRAFGSANAFVFCQLSLGVKHVRWRFALRGLASAAAGLLILAPSLILGADRAVSAGSRIARGLGEIAGALNLRYRRYGATG